MANRIDEQISSLMTTGAQPVQERNLGASAIPKASKSVMIQDINQFFDYYKQSTTLKSASEESQKNSRRRAVFRRVSQNSSPDSWIHPGIEARNFGRKALAEFESESKEYIGKITEAVLTELNIL